MPDLSNLNTGLDTPKVAGMVVIGALLVLASLRKGFAGVKVSLGD